MKHPSLYTTLIAILLATGCLMAVTGAHAQEQARAQAPAQALAPSLQSAVVRISTVADSINVADVAAPPAEAAARDRELIRAHRMERRMMISESTGIPLGELDDLLRKIRPTADERSNDERRTQTGRLSAGEIDENP